MRTAIQNLAKRREDEEGFTLIELMVVVLIIAILMAIAIPTFLSARNSANDRAAQSDLRNALTAEKSIYVNDGQSYVSDTASLSSAEANLNWTSGFSALAKNNGIAVSLSTGGHTVCLVTQSASGGWYEITDNGASTMYGTLGSTPPSTCAMATPSPPGSSPTSPPYWSSTAW